MPRFFYILQAEFMTNYIELYPIRFAREWRNFLKELNFKSART